MRKLIICVFIFLLVSPVWAATPQTEDQKALYALGADLAKKLSIFDLTADEFEFVKQGMSDVIAGKKLEAEPEAYQQSIGILFQARMIAAAQRQKMLAKPYLEKAAKEKDAQLMASGLVYQSIKVGTGAQPKGSDVVKVHYTGTFIDGKEFDSSVKRGQPLEFQLDQVIPCWTEGLAKMKIGGKAKLICPSDIAYGDQGRPPIVPGGATLIFDVELLDAKAAPASASTPAKKPAASKTKTKK
ncbi:fkbp-type peptidyl-prolyl cis-trans isomerase fkpa precursor [hydrocarbon metagenome]|uniref:peptidylprolyl isomerase n=1 Tax=hydrocarbon metagenome TaxID=938273 RepID=A0A0W8FRA2_9ZZZZ